MKLCTRREEKEPQIMIIPMIDIIFFLLVFFMMSMLSMTMDRSVPLALPSARTAQAAEGTPVAVSVTADGRLFVEKEPVAREDFVRRMAIEKARRGDLSALLRADADARHGDVLFALEGLREAGVTQIGIAAEASR